LFEDLLGQALDRTSLPLLVLIVRSDVGLRGRQLRNVSRKLARLGRASRGAGLCTPAAALALAPRSGEPVRALAASRASR
jgi:hypothetical protein